MSTPDESTTGREDARKALAESRRNGRRADMLIAESQATLGRLREQRDRNHFADKFRAVIRGAT